MIACLPAQGQGKMKQQNTVNLTETDGVYTLTYQDGIYERRVTFFDWYSAQANYERRAQEAGQESAGRDEE